ncbi:response regulator [Roseimaritima multifibrata]|nr:response regulator [Roseimaritima multifibrata]
MSSTIVSTDKPIHRVVLVDDDSTDNFLHKRVLEKSGLVEEVIAFEQPEMALDYLASIEHPIDVICLDINMPKMNGFEFLEAYQKLEIAKKQLPLVVILSTSVTAESIACKQGISSVVAAETKPLRRETVEQLVIEYFNGASSIAQS